MKKIALLFAAASAAALVAVSCNKDDNKVKTVSATVTVDESGLAEGIETPSSYTVTLTNSSTGRSVTASTENGSATVSDIIPGTYAVTASAKNANGGFTYTFSGSVTSASIIADGTEVSVKIAAVKESAIVLKEAFIAGNSWGQTDPTNLWSGKTYFRGQFWELYNNSTETVYADSIALAQVEYASYDYSTIYQWDIPNPEKYVFATTVWQIPGDGTTYPIKPGESFIVAQWATNHNVETLTDNHSVDLSTAEFEAIEGEKTISYAGITVTDGPAVNMKYAVESSYAGWQWLVSVSDAALVVFKPSKPLQNENFISATNKDSEVAREIAIDDILDAVQWYSDEATWADATKHNLPSVLDAGYAEFTSYCNKGIARKVAYTREDGTKVYQDTNNSSEDFEVVTPQIRRGDAKIPSWNTWAK